MSVSSRIKSAIDILVGDYLLNRLETITQQECATLGGIDTYAQATASYSMYRPNKAPAIRVNRQINTSYGQHERKLIDSTTKSPTTVYTNFKKKEVDIRTWNTPKHTSHREKKLVDQVKLNYKDLFND